MKILILGSVCLICSSQLAPLVAQERPPIIDMHMHADLPPHDVSPGTPAICRPEPCRGEGRATANHAETLEKTLEAMEHYNIVRGFVSGLDLEALVGAGLGMFRSNRAGTVPEGGPEAGHSLSQRGTLPSS